MRSNSSVACWGWDGDGRATPPAGSFVSVSAGRYHTCGVTSDGPVACWGSDYSDRDYFGQATPPAGSFVSVSAGWSHTCGVRSDGSVPCWGSDYYSGDYYGQATPPAGSFVSVSAGYFHTLRGKEQRLRRLLGLGWIWPGHSARVAIGEGQGLTPLL